MSNAEQRPTTRRRITRALSAPARWVLLGAWCILMMLGTLVSGLAFGLLALALRLGGKKRTRAADRGFPRVVRVGAPA